MNPYATLSKLGAFNALDATFVKKNGEEIAILVKPESVDDEPLDGGFLGSVKIRVWSTSTTTIQPEEGDALVVTNEDGSTTRYPVTRNAVSSRYWDWKYRRVGARIVFYTRF